MLYCYISIYNIVRFSLDYSFLQLKYYLDLQSFVIFIYLYSFFSLLKYSFAEALSGNVIRRKQELVILFTPTLHSKPCLPNRVILSPNLLMKEFLTFCSHLPLCSILPHLVTLSSIVLKGFS